jgi:hypothetical protein
MPGTFDIKQTNCIVSIFKYETGRLVDRRGSRARGRIGSLTGVQAQGVETYWIGGWHMRFLFYKNLIMG